MVQLVLPADHCLTVKTGRPPMEPASLRNLIPSHVRKGVSAELARRAHIHLRVQERRNRTVRVSHRARHREREVFT